MIFMLDDKENLVQARLFVKDQEGLVCFLNELTDSSNLDENNNYKVLSNKKKSSFGNLVYFGNYKQDDLLVKNYKVSFEAKEYFGEDLEWVFEYEQDIIKCNTLYSVLLFFNLLDISSSYLMDELAVEFLNSGILKKESIEKVWKKFVSNCEHENGGNNLNNFWYALEYNLIGVSIENTWTKEELQEEGLLKKFNINLNDLIANTNIFNKGSYLVKRRSK